MEKLYNIDELEKLKKEYPFELIYTTSFKKNGNYYFVETYKLTVEGFLEKNKGKEVFIYEPFLPGVRAVVI